MGQVGNSVSLAVVVFEMAAHVTCVYEFLPFVIVKEWDRNKLVRGHASLTLRTGNYFSISQLSL